MRQIHEVLSCDPQTKFLILHADDLGMAHAINAASSDAFEAAAISSASVMVPCQWFPEAVTLLKGHDNYDIGVHLTLTSEWRHCKWRPVLGANQVPSLVDSAGYFPEKLRHIDPKPSEVKAELMAQVEGARAAGLAITHLDCHMFSVFMRADLINVYLEVGRECGLQCFVPRGVGDELRVAGFHNEIGLVVDRVLQATVGTAPENWRAMYGRLINSLRPGLTVLSLHLGYDGPELQGMMAGIASWGAVWRQCDYEAMVSTDIKAALSRTDVQIINWGQTVRR